MVTYNQEQLRNLSRLQRIQTQQQQQQIQTQIKKQQVQVTPIQTQQTQQARNEYGEWVQAEKLVRAGKGHAARGDPNLWGKVKVLRKHLGFMQSQQIADLRAQGIEPVVSKGKLTGGVIQTATGGVSVGVDELTKGYSYVPSQELQSSQREDRIQDDVQRYEEAGYSKQRAEQLAEYSAKTQTTPTSETIRGLPKPSYSYKNIDWKQTISPTTSKEEYQDLMEKQGFITAPEYVDYKFASGPFGYGSSPVKKINVNLFGLKKTFDTKTGMGLSELMKWGLFSLALSTGAASKGGRVKGKGKAEAEVKYIRKFKDLSDKEYSDVINTIRAGANKQDLRKFMQDAINSGNKDLIIQRAKLLEDVMGKQGAESLVKDVLEQQGVSFIRPPPTKLPPTKLPPVKLSSTKPIDSLTKENIFIKSDVPIIPPEATTSAGTIASAFQGTGQYERYSPSENLYIKSDQQKVSEGLGDSMFTGLSPSGKIDSKLSQGKISGLGVMSSTKFLSSLASASAQQTKTGQQIKTAQQTKTGQQIKTTQQIKQDAKQRTKLLSSLASALSSKTKQAQQQRYNQLTRQGYRPRQPGRPKPRQQGFPPIIPMFTSGAGDDIRREKFFEAFKKAYEVQVKRGEQFSPISRTPLPLGLALKLGSERVSETLAATFRLVPKGTTTKEDITFRLSPAQFRKPKSGEKLVYVEKKEKRIKKGVGEIPEILGIRKSTYKKRGGKSKKLKWL